MLQRINRYYLFAFGIFILLVIIFISVIVLSFSGTEEIPNQNPTTRIIPTPTKSAPLHPKEEAYSEAKPQEYYSDGTNKTGVLVVTASYPDVRVMIDDGHSEGPVTPKTYPIQRTPFRIDDIPTGDHMLRAVKPGYLISEIPVTITEGNITRVQIQLKPIKPVN